MYKDQIFAIAIIVLLGALCVYLYAEGQQYKSFAKVVVDQWGEREDRLVSLCQIDYNDALIAERDKLINDANDFVFGVGG